MTNKEIAEKSDTSDKMISQWVSTYIKNGGIKALFPKKRIGNHRNLSFEEEAEFLAEFAEQAKAEKIIDTNELKAAYIAKVGHSIGGNQIYLIPSWLA